MVAGILAAVPSSTLAYDGQVLSSGGNIAGNVWTELPLQAGEPAPDLDLLGTDA